MHFFRSMIYSWIPGLFLLLMACGESKPKRPDVSKIKAAIQVVRFDDAVFSLDTNQLDQGLEQLHRQHPGFTKDYLYNIVGAPPHPDSTKKILTSFIRTYASLYRDSRKQWTSLEPQLTDLSQAMKYLKHYFPNYNIPSRLYVFMGPINSFGNIITADGLAAGLQLYMGKDYPAYLTEEGQVLYPYFISRKFDKAYLAVNCVRNMVDDLYPNNSIGRPLVEQMVEAGKRAVLLDYLLPETADTLKLGYTEKQWKGCLKNEANIWSFFMNSDLLYATDPNLVNPYMNDGPNTPALGPDSPGFIGLFCGKRIVETWMKKHPETSLQDMMQTDATKIFRESKYKP